MRHLNLLLFEVASPRAPYKYFDPPTHQKIHLYIFFCFVVLDFMLVLHFFITLQKIFRMFWNAFFSTFISCETISSLLIRAISWYLISCKFIIFSLEKIWFLSTWNLFLNENGFIWFFPMQSSEFIKSLSFGGNLKKKTAKKNPKILHF